MMWAKIGGFGTLENQHTDNSVLAEKRNDHLRLRVLPTPGAHGFVIRVASHIIHDGRGAGANHASDHPLVDAEPLQLAIGFLAVADRGLPDKLLSPLVHEENGEKLVVYKPASD